MTPALLKEIAPELRSAAACEGKTLKARVVRTEAEEIRTVLDSFEGDREKVCTALGISKTMLWRKLNGTR